jgi:glycosyltransferase involved in cell wall biosynthesis
VGTYVRALNFGWALAGAGHQVMLCTVARIDTRHVRRDRAREVEILEMPGWGYTMLPGWGSGPLDIWERLKLIRRGEFDIVYGFEYQPNVAWPVYLTWRGRRYAFVSDWCDWHAGGSNVYRGVRLAHRIDGWLEERIRYRAQALTVISTVLKERALALGLAAERVTLIEEGVDTDYIRPMPQAEARAAHGFAGDDLLVGAMTDVEMDRVIRIFDCLRQRIPRARLVIIGRRKPAVAALVEQLGMREAVCETGFVSDQDLPGYLACPDVYFLPMSDTVTHRARWPHKVNDFMAAGKATVISPIGDIASMFDVHHIGALAVTDEDFVERLTGLLGDADHRRVCGENARRLAVERLDWRVLAPRIVRAVEGAGQRTVT